MPMLLKSSVDHVRSIASSKQTKYLSSGSSMCLDCDTTVNQELPFLSCMGAPPDILEQPLAGVSPQSSIVLGVIQGQMLRLSGL